jgi:hypothetical protein
MAIVLPSGRIDNYILKELAAVFVIVFKGATDYGSIVML